MRDGNREVLGADAAYLSSVCARSGSVARGVRASITPEAGLYPRPWLYVTYMAELNQHFRVNYIIESTLRSIPTSDKSPIPTSDTKFASVHDDAI